ncbi:2-dehydro-3-deoxygalactonokinase [Wenyingzhuangia sp. IMCC45574]
MSLPKQFISCDWGTSNFRLRLVDSDSLNIVKEVTSNTGVKKLFQEFQNNESDISQTAFFVQFLKTQIQQLELTTTPTIIASGMATASIGMLELPYIDMPVNFKGDNLLSKAIHQEELNIILVSGAKTDSDVMRGEEIQAVGLSQHIPSNTKGVLLLPGTHSKHIQFNNGVFTSFTTYMTGELFDVIQKQTLLENSLTKSNWSSQYEQNFLNGVYKGLNSERLASLFTIRANDLLANATKEENFYFLSGLLIGGELSYLQNNPQEVYIATTGILHTLYKLALDQINCNLTSFNADMIDKALLIGHKQILASYV